MNPLLALVLGTTAVVALSKRKNAAGGGDVSVKTQEQKVAVAARSEPSTPTTCAGDTQATNPGDAAGTAIDCFKQAYEDPSAFLSTFWDAAVDGITGDSGAPTPRESASGCSADTGLAITSSDKHRFDLAAKQFGDECLQAGQSSTACKNFVALNGGSSSVDFSEGPMTSGCDEIDRLRNTIANRYPGRYQQVERCYGEGPVNSCPRVLTELTSRGRVTI